MVKQDAMNVFLGFYVPNDMIQPLWDLDSDYYLHNKTLRPPVPSVNKILYREDHLAKKQGLGLGLVLISAQDQGWDKGLSPKDQGSEKHKGKGSEIMLKRYRYMPARC